MQLMQAGNSAKSDNLHHRPWSEARRPSDGFCSKCSFPPPAHQWTRHLQASLEMTETEANGATQIQDEDHFQPTDNGAPSPLRTLCEELHEKVFAFLEEDVPTEVLKNVQGQCIRTITIISDALTNYPSALPSPRCHT